MESHGSVISLLSPGAHAAPAPRSSNAFWPCCTTTPTACTYSWLVEREEGQESNIEHHLHATSTTLSEIIERRGGGLSPLTNTRRPLGRASHALWHAAGGGRLCGHVCAIREGNPRHVISTKSRPGGGGSNTSPAAGRTECLPRTRPTIRLTRSHSARMSTHSRSVTTTDNPRRRVAGADIHGAGVCTVFLGCLACEQTRHRAPTHLRRRQPAPASTPAPAWRARLHGGT